MVRESRASANHGYDLPGAATVTGGLLALVYGFTKAGTDGWSSSTTVEFFVAAAVLLFAFVVIEMRAEHPLLPLRVVLDRDRGGSFIASLLVGTAMLGTFLSLTYYFQNTLHYSALKSGFAFVPFSLGIIAGAAAASRFLPRFGPRLTMGSGLVMAAAGLALFSTLGVDSTYVSIVLPAELIVSLGMGMSFVAMSSTALIGVNPEDAGVASALVNSTQQTGGTMGAALINTIATTATVSYLAVHGSSPAALEAGAIHGYTSAFTFSAIVLAVAADGGLHPHPPGQVPGGPGGGAGGGAAGPGRGLRARAPALRTAADAPVAAGVSGGDAVRSGPSRPAGVRSAVSRMSGWSSMAWCPASGISMTGVTRPSFSNMKAPISGVTSPYSERSRARRQLT